MGQSQSMVLETEKIPEREALTEDRMELLIRSYGDSLLRLCTLYLRDPYLAEDALQDWQFCSIIIRRCRCRR